MHFLYLVSQASASGKQRARYWAESTAELLAQVETCMLEEEYQAHLIPSAGVDSSGAGACLGSPAAGRPAALLWDRRYDHFSERGYRLQIFQEDRAAAPLAADSIAGAR